MWARWKNTQAATRYYQSRKPLRDDLMRYRFSFNGFGRHKWIRRCPQTAAYQIEPAACSGALSVAEALEFKETNCHVGEEKFDGLRYLLQVYPCDDNESYMTSRRVSVITKLFVEKQAKTLVPLNPHGIDRKLVSVKAFPFKAALKGCVFDGELFSKGLSSDAQHDMLHGRAEYHVFDVLFANGKFVGHLPLYKRIAIRDSLAKHFPHWMKLVRNTRNIQWLIKEVLKRKGEGIIIKDLSAPYGEGWEKVKTEITEDVLICGYEDTNSAAYKKKGWIGSIKIAQYIPIGIFSKWRNNKDAPAPSSEKRSDSF